MRRSSPAALVAAVLALALGCKREEVPAADSGVVAELSRVRRQRRLRRVPRRGGRGLARLAARARDPARRSERRARRLHAGGVRLARRRLLRARGRSRRRARRLPREVQLRARAAAAVPARASGRTPAGLHARVGRARAALDRPVPRREARARRRAALVGSAAELELHVRRLSLDERAQGLRPGDPQLRHEVERLHGRLRGLPRSRLEARRLGAHARERAGARAHGRARRAPRRALVDRPAHGQRRAQPPARGRHRDRDLRALPLAARADRRGLARGRAVPRLLPPRAARVAGVLGRRPAARRGLHLGLVPAEPHVRARRHLQRLPRAARRRAARRGQRAVRAVSLGREVRRPGAPFPPA